MARFAESRQSCPGRKREKTSEGGLVLPSQPPLGEICSAVTSSNTLHRAGAQFAHRARTATKDVRNASLMSGKGVSSKTADLDALLSLLLIHA